MCPSLFAETVTSLTGSDRRIGLTNPSVQGLAGEYQGILWNKDQGVIDPHRVFSQRMQCGRDHPCFCRKDWSYDLKHVMDLLSFHVQAMGTCFHVAASNVSGDTDHYCRVRASPEPERIVVAACEVRSGA